MILQLKFKRQREADKEKIKKILSQAKDIAQSVVVLAGVSYFMAHLIAWSWRQ